MLPGAKFVFEVELHKERPSKSEPWGGRWVERTDGAKIIISSLGRYSAKDHILQSINRYDLIKDGILIETEFEDFCLRYHDTGELANTLETVGFQKIRMLTDYTGAPAVETDESVIVECSKAL